MQMDGLSLLAECEYVIEKVIGRLKLAQKKDPTKFEEAKKSRKKDQRKEQDEKREIQEKIERELAQQAAVAKRERKVTKAYGKPMMKRFDAPAVKKHEEKKVELQEWQKDFISYDLGDTLEHFNGEHA
jgi:hypothetical protein